MKWTTPTLGLQAQIPALFSHLFPIWPALFSRHLLGEEPGNTFWVAINCVEEPWEGEAEDGSQEEQSNDHFLLHRCYKGHVWPEHVEDSQTKEEHTSWKTARQRGVKFMHIESFFLWASPLSFKALTSWKHSNMQLKHVARNIIPINTYILGKGSI